MDNRQMKEDLHSLIFRETQIKRMRYQLTFVKQLSSKIPQISNVGKDVEKREPLNTFGGI